MLFIVILANVIYTFIKSTNIETIRKKMFTLSIILSLFFFSSSDPIIGMPLYVYPMLFSVALSLIHHKKVKRSFIFIFILLLFSMLVPLIRMELSAGTERYFLIKESSTDTLSINNQMFIPNVDFTVIKHFIFMLTYAVFVILNADIVKNDNYIQNLLHEIIIIFRVLIIGIIIEWGIVNALGGINDRYLMGGIFSLKNINQKINWKTWGSYSVAFWLAERSNFNIIALFYMIYLKKKDIKTSEWMWIALSALAIYCTGSSSCLAILALYLLAETFVVLIQNKKINQVIFMSVIVVSFTVVLTSNIELFTNKLQAFFSWQEIWNSGFFRANSIYYGIKAIKDHIFFGVGIGTVLAHSMLIQTLANIGFIGTALMLYLHGAVCPKRNMATNIVTSVFIVGISYGCYMVQNFTSPFLITIFIILNCSEELLDAKQDSKDNSLLLVREKSFAGIGKAVY